MIKYKEVLACPYNAIFRNRGRPLEQRTVCLCICPTCRKKYILKSNSLYTDRINWIYCNKDEKNRFRDPEGYEELFSDDIKNNDPSLESHANTDDMGHWQKHKKRLGL